MGDAPETMVAVCEDCGGVKVPAWHNGPMRCAPCADARKVKWEAEKRAQDEERRRGYVLEAADNCTPERYKRALLKDFSDQVSTKVRKWMDTAESEMQQLLVFGPVGTGKTHLACAITRELILSRLEGKFWRHEVKYASQATFLREIRKSWDSSEVTEDYIFSLHTKPRILVLDDIGAARGNENDALRLSELISDRYDAMRPSVFVTNLTPEQLKGAVGDRAYDRMRDNGVQIVLNGESRRRPAA